MTVSSRRQARGVALVLVLLGIAFMTFLGFALGDLCVINLNMSRQFLASSRANLLAQAAVAQFMVTFDQACKRARTNGLDLEKKQGVDLDLRALYASGEGLPNRNGTDMPGKVTITFDSSQPNYSTDNSMNEYSKAGWSDRGTSEKSVPPFSVDLVVSVQIDGTTRTYEAIVTRRWPYAVFAEKGLIVICGTPVSSGASTDQIVSPSSVEGRVGTMETHPPLSDIPLMPKSGAIVVDQGGVSQGYLGALGTVNAVASQIQRPPMTLSKLMGALLQVEQGDYTAYADAAVTIGPDMKMKVRNEPASNESSSNATGLPGLAGSPLPLSVTTVTNTEASAPATTQPNGLLTDPLSDAKVTEQGNALVGDVYVPGAFRPAHVGGADLGSLSFSQDIKPIDALSGNTFTGRVHYDEFPDGVDRQHNPIEDATFPNIFDSDYKKIPRPEPPPEVKAQLAMYQGQQPGTEMSATTLQNPNANGANDKIDFGFLFGTLNLDPEAGDNPPFQFGGSNRFVFIGDLGNRFIKGIPKSSNPTSPAAEPSPSPDPNASNEPIAFNVFESAGAIKLNNCVLYVTGNLDLSAKKRAGSEVGIEGNNSTLIVNGTLAINGGHLDSRDQGMVIMANDIILRAGGEYRGLIIAKNSLAILPASPDANAASVLTIRGGVMCGNNDANIILRSVHLIYDPVYMKAVHNYGKAACTLWRDLK